MIPIGDYMPDQPALTNPGSNVITNAIPLTGGHYGPVPSAVVSNSGALDSRVCGAASLRDRNNAPVLYVGTKAKLWREVGGVYQERTRASGDYSVDAQDGWEFVTFGSRVFAAARAQQVQFADLWTNTQFQDYPQTLSAPTIARIGDFLVVGSPNYASNGEQPNRVQWSAAGNPLDMVPDASGTQAGFQDLAGDWGPVLRLVAFEYGIVFRERAIHRMEFVGGDIIWSFGAGPIATDTGPVSRSAVATYGDSVMYLGNEGFIVLERGYNVRAVGEGRVDRTVLDDLAVSRVGEISTIVDPTAQLVYWLYPSNSAPPNLCDRIIVWNYVADRWASIEESLEWLSYAASGGILADDMTAGNGWPVADDLVGVLMDDYTQFSPGGKGIIGWDGTHQRVDFTGAARTAVLETTEAYISPPNRTMVTGVRPIIEGGVCTLSLVYRQTQSAAPQETAGAAQRPSGRVPLRKSARYFRARMSIAGGFDAAMGIEDVEGATAEWR